MFVTEIKPEIVFIRDLLISLMKVRIQMLSDVSDVKKIDPFFLGHFGSFG